MKHVLLAVVLFGVMPNVAFGQDKPSLPAQFLMVPDRTELQERYDELVEWLKDYEKWTKWYDLYGNKFVPGFFIGTTGKVNPPPDPPHWLAEDCAMIMDADGKWGEACDILKNWGNLYWHLERRKAIPGVVFTGNVASDQGQKSSFLQRIHFMAGWVPAHFPMPKVYSLLGVQYGIIEKKRVTFPTVGFHLVALRNGKTWSLTPATSVGIGVQMFDFPFPGTKRMAYVHANLAQLKLHDVDQSLPVNVSGDMSFAGLSLTFKKLK
jgi:hypothetical protein